MADLLDQIHAESTGDLLDKVHAQHPALYGHPGYQSKAPGIIGRMDNAVSDSVDAMATGAQKLFGSGKTVDERLGGASQAARGFLNSAGLPFMLQAGVAAPARVAKGVVTGLVGQKVGSETAKALGAGPGTQDFVGDATGVVTGAAGSQIPVGRAGSALYQAGKAGVKALPVVGKMAKAGVEDFRKSAPDYVDPKVTRQAELTAQAGERAKARVHGTAEAKAKLKADAEAKVKADAEAKAAADKDRLAQTRAELAARGKGSDAPDWADPVYNPPLPKLYIPQQTRSISGRVPGTGAPAPKPPSLTQRIDAIPEQSPTIPAQPSLPEVAPTPPADNRTFGGRLYGGAPKREAQSPRVPIWQQGEAKPNAPIEMTPQQPPTPLAPRVVAPREAPAAVAPQPQAPAPSVANGGPSAPEGSAVIPPVEGRPNRYGDMGGKLGEQVARDAHAKDTAVAKYLTDQGVTQGQFRAADPAQKARWAREANPKYKGYTDPDRIDDLANLLQPDAPAAPAGPTLYQGKQ